MKDKEKREVYFFSRLAKALYEDVEALEALHYCHSFSDILTTLQCYGYLKEMTLEGYVETALQAADDLKYFLDPDTGDFSEDAVSNEDEASDVLEERVLEGDAAIEGVDGGEQRKAGLAPVAAGRWRARHELVELARLGGEVHARRGEIGDQRARAARKNVERILVVRQDAGGLVRALLPGEPRKLAPASDVALDEVPVEPGVFVFAARVVPFARRGGHRQRGESGQI